MAYFVALPRRSYWEQNIQKYISWGEIGERFGENCLLSETPQLTPRSELLVLPGLCLCEKSFHPSSLTPGGWILPPGNNESFLLCWDLLM